MNFFKGADLVWIIGIVSSIVAGLNAWKKYRYEEKLKQFKETNINLFKEEKEIVLAAISTLSIFKRDPRFEKHTTNVLLSRLYTELDYDITNAICNALIQYSNREELLDISSEILDINRNFFVQTSPVSGMTADLDKNWSELKKALAEKTKVEPQNNTTQSNNPDESTTLAAEEKAIDKKDITEIEKAIADDLLALYKKRSITWIPKNRYEFLWHKQITADTYSRILRRASYYDNSDGESSSWQRYFRLGKTKQKVNRFTELDMRFYQNDFNYVYMADFVTISCKISRSAISQAMIIDVAFNNIESINQTYFDGSTFDKCSFYGGRVENSNDNSGKIEDDTFFRKSTFITTRFEAITLNDVDFNEALFENCQFIDARLETGTALTSCNFKGGSFESVIIQNVDLSDSEFNNTAFSGFNTNTLEFNDVIFNQNRFTNCRFKNVVIANCPLVSSLFAQCQFENVVFENVNFSETYFAGSSLIDVQFNNCNGLSSRHFYKYKTIKGNSHLPSNLTKKEIDALKTDEVKKAIAQSSLYEKGKKYLQTVIGPPGEAS